MSHILGTSAAFVLLVYRCPISRLACPGEHSFSALMAYKKVGCSASEGCGDDQREVALITNVHDKISLA